MIRIIEKRSIKFYLDKSVNKSKKDEIVNFLDDCANVQNQLYKYFWDDKKYEKYIIGSNDKMTFNRKCREIGVTNVSLYPVLKSHHFQQVSQDVYGFMMGQKVKIRNSIKFDNMEDKNKFKVYQYCKKLCFEWDYLNKYINKQINKFKKADDDYYKFICNIKHYLDDDELFTEMKTHIEAKFWEAKDKIKRPQMKNPTIWCSSFHTIELQQNSYYNWYFTLDSNTKLSAKRMHKIIIPIKYSDYHYKTIGDRKLSTSFKIKLDNRGRIEIMAIYDINVENTINTPTQIIGVDIGLKKLIFSSDGEMLEQNQKILNYASYIRNRRINKQRLEQHMRDKLQDEKFSLGNNRILKQNAKLIHMVNCDNRYKIKQFLKGREKDLIIMEDLNIHYENIGNKNVNYLINTLHIQSIKNDMVRYCKERGINLELINPAFTSQQCPKCNYIGKDNRTTQELFKCVKCGHIDNADHNASVNILNRYFIKDIKLNMKPLEVKQILELNYIACG